jgi:hypothetical protein
MKNLRILLLVAAFAGLSACHFGRRHATIVETGNNYYLRIEYSGKIYFNDDGTAISSISPGGYVKYENNEKKLEAWPNRNGGVRYELSYDGEKLNPDNNGRPFIAEAVKVMLLKNHRPSWK